MRQIISILILLIILLFSSISSAQIKSEADLDNFRGLKWGMDISQLPKDEFIEDRSSIPEEKVFLRKSEDLNVLGIEAKKNSYRFMINRFFGVVILFGFNQKNELRDSLEEFLGKPYDVKKEAADFILKVNWKGENIWVTEMISFKKNIGSSANRVGDF